MSGLMYRPDMDDVRRRLTTWWNGGDIGRPAVQIGVAREKPWEEVPAMPEPPGWVTGYSTSSFEYRVNLSARGCIHSDYLGESVPAVSPDLAPNCLALYLGCHGVEMPGTVWCQPCMRTPGEAKFEYDPDNFYWDFSRRLGLEQKRLGQGKFLLHFPDLIEGLDTLAAMRGSEELLMDLIERPEWVHACLRSITDRYFHYYDMLYDMMRDEVGGSLFWCWAPGRMAKFQCDFSAMISPAMFGEFMVPVLTEMTERVSYSMYHWDGPGAIPHHDHLLSIPKLNMLQWTPGAGADSAGSRRWWPMYHKTLDAGKKLYVGVASRDEFLAMRKEFGPRFKQFLISCWWAMTRPEAEDLLHRAEV
jgi:5-methyltetrahydrofolate--homocysteine methyltransferase